MKTQTIETLTSELIRIVHETQRIIDKRDGNYFRAVKIQRVAAIELQARVDLIGNNIDESTLILDTNERKAS